MKIGEHLIYDAERLSRVQKNLCRRLPAEIALLDPTLFSAASSECTHDRGTNGQHPTIALHSSIQSFRSGLGNFVGLRVNFVIFEAFRAHRLKSAQADVQRDFGDFYAALLQTAQYFGREMQARGWSGHGATLPGVNGLVAFAVHRLVGTFDIGRQGECGRSRSHRFAKVIPRSKAQHPESEGSTSPYVRPRVLPLRR